MSRRIIRPIQRAILRSLYATLLETDALVGRAKMQSQLRKVTVEDFYYGRLVESSGLIRNSGSAPEKCTCTDGYAIGSSGNDLWVGGTVEEVKRNRERYEIKVSDEDLVRLEKEGGKILFDHPGNGWVNAEYDVYRLDDHAAHLAYLAGKLRLPYLHVHNLQVRQKLYELPALVPRRGDLIVLSQTVSLSDRVTAIFASDTLQEKFRLIPSVLGNRTDPH